jgi:hypothetical protein
MTKKALRPLTLLFCGLLISLANNQLLFAQSTLEHKISSTVLTSFVVKESAQVSTKNFPNVAIFPLKYGEYQNVNDFYLKDQKGNIVPAQFEVLNRWWGKDNSLRHVQAIFNAALPAFEQGKKKSGVNTYQLLTGSKKVEVFNPVNLQEKSDEIQISNNLLAINIQKNPLVITTPAGKLHSVFYQENNEIDYSFKHDNIKFDIEEAGPIRTVVKISSATEYKTPTKIKHGWALRLYVYANSAQVKLDFQLQNSAINTSVSAPLYFKGHNLIIDDAKVEKAQTVRADKLNAKEIQSTSAGYISSQNVNVFFHNFWQTFPNGLSTEEGKLKIEMWPTWTGQFMNDHFVDIGLYWLDDMKHTYHEVWLDFSKDNSVEHVTAFAKTVQNPPVVNIPQDYYAKTKATLELGGYFPYAQVSPKKQRALTYSPKGLTKKKHGALKFGMNNYAIDSYRKKRTSNGGGWPYSNRKFFVSGNPSDYYHAQEMAKAEINIRPQWLGGYLHEKHFKSITPSTNPYGGTSWRQFVNHKAPTLSREYISGSKQTANPRDDQHAWFYHVEQAYLMSGNKWLKDWYVFMAEFKKIYLQELDPWPDRSNRSEGHALNTALAAYRVTGDSKLGELLSNYVVKVHSKYLLPPHNLSIGRLDKKKPSAAVFQQGFLVKSFINLYNEFSDQEKTLALIRSYVKWNLTYANYGYYRSIISKDVTKKASGSSATYVDAAIWYALISGEKKYADHAINFVQKGIGGVKPYGKWATWQGQYEGQLYNYYLQQLNEREKVSK